jgi:hypothetical protein
MKLGERLTMDRLLDGTLGATPCINIVRTMGLGLSILNGAVLIPKPIVKNNAAREGRRIAVNIAKLPELSRKPIG